MRYFKFYLISLGVIALDQLVKLLVYYNMDMGSMGEIRLLGDVVKLHYTLNPGMAFGVEFGSVYGKLFLSIFRLGAMVAIAAYLYILVQKKAARGYIICISLVLGGAIGNLIDSIFYGVLLNNAPYDAPTPWFNGQVIDMFYFDIWEGVLPDWLPLLGGQYYSLWPIFNVADSAIFLGILFILIFQKHYLKEELDNKDTGVASGTN